MALATCDAPFSVGGLHSQRRVKESDNIVSINVSCKQSNRTRMPRLGSIWLCKIKWRSPVCGAIEY